MYTLYAIRYFVRDTIHKIRDTVLYFLDLEKKLCYTIFDFMHLLSIIITTYDNFGIIR